MSVVKVEVPVNVLKKIKCNGKFSKGEQCDVVIFGINDLNNWLCPFHEQRVQKSNPLETPEVQKEIVNPAEESSKKEQTSKNEAKPIQSANSELRAFEEVDFVTAVLNWKNKRKIMIQNKNIFLRDFNFQK